MYQKNPDMEYIQSDDTSLVVFDPESGSTHFFEDSGCDILKLLESPRSLDDLLDALCKIYAAKPDEIRADVEEFLEDVVSKKVVLVL